MAFSLQGKTALVSGSTTGIGFATAETLASQGARVIVNGRTAARVDEAVGRIRKAVPKADVVGFAADLTSAAGAKALSEAHPAVDILVNNLGLGPVKTFDATTDEDWLDLYNANVVSGVRLSRVYLPHLRAKNWGRIIFLSSLVGESPAPIALNYSVTKTAVIAVARGLAELVAGTSITVNSVIVGPTQTDMLGDFFGEVGALIGAPSDAVAKNFAEGTLVKRLLQPAEIAAAIAYLSSPAASATTGAALRVDGGSVKHI